MRIVFRDVDVARRKASALKAALAGGARQPNLTACRDAVARVYGYSRWAELKTYVGTASDGDDFARLDLERAAAAVSETLGVTRAEAEEAVAVVGFRSVRGREATAAPHDSLAGLFELSRETGGVMVGTDGRIFVRHAIFFRHEPGQVTDEATLGVLRAFFADYPDDGRDRQVQARRDDTFGLVRRTRQDGLDVFYVYGIARVADVRERLGREFRENLEVAMRKRVGTVVLGWKLPCDAVMAAYLKEVAASVGARPTLVERFNGRHVRLDGEGTPLVDLPALSVSDQDGIVVLFDDQVTSADEAIDAAAEVPGTAPVVMAASAVRLDGGRWSVECLPVGGPPSVRPG